MNRVEATVVKRFHFDAAHHLPGYPGICARVHGHRWEVEVGVSGRVMDNGMVMDFAELKKAVQPLIDEYCHTDLNDHFLMPTAENIARVLWNSILMRIVPGSDLALKFVRVWESPDSYAEVPG